MILGFLAAESSSPPERERYRDEIQGEMRHIERFGVVRRYWRDLDRGIGEKW